MLWGQTYNIPKPPFELTFGEEGCAGGGSGGGEVLNLFRARIQTICIIVTYWSLEVHQN